MPMTLAGAVSLALTLGQTIKNMVDSGRAETTAQEDAALEAARKRANDADDCYDAADREATERSPE